MESPEPLTAQPTAEAGGLPSRRPAAGSAFRPAVVAEWLLGLIALGCLGFVAFAAIDERTFQARQTARLDALVADRIEHVSLATTSYAARGARLRQPAPGEPIGRLEIAAAGVSGMVTPGTDDGTLRHSIGWVEGTSLPGEPGNVGLAAHRDTFFRGLRRVQLDDVITLRTPEMTYRYRIDALRVVTPEQVDVLAARDQPALTLITCYPFDFLGAAPLRYVVHASQIDSPNPP